MTPAYEDPIPTGAAVLGQPFAVLDHQSMAPRWYVRVEVAGRTELLQVAEEWRWVPGYRGRYKVSSFGRVLNVRTGKLLRCGPTRKDYLQCTLKARRKKKCRLVHRLVAGAFLGVARGDLQINHKNGLKDDNHVWNLEWTAPIENIKHAFKHGLFSSRLKLNFERAREMRRRHAAGATFKELAEEFGVSAGHVRSVCRGLCWRDAA